MSEQNIELMRRLIEAYNAHDIEAIIALCDSNVEWHPYFAAAELGDAGVYHGHDGLRKWHRGLQDAWGDDIRVEPETYFDLGERTLATYTFHGRGRRSGAEVAVPATAMMRWRDGLIVYFKAYGQRVDALEDLGIAENTLEPIAP